MEMDMRQSRTKKKLHSKDEGRLVGAYLKQTLRGSRFGARNEHNAFRASFILRRGQQLAYMASDSRVTDE
jgi:hypothetical protein